MIHQQLETMKKKYYHETLQLYSRKHKTHKNKLKKPNKPISVNQASTPEISTPTPINPTSTNIQQRTQNTTSTAPDTSNPKLQPSTTTKNQQPTTTATSNTTTTLQIQRMR